MTLHWMPTTCVLALLGLVAGCDDRDDEVRYREIERDHVCRVDCHHHVHDGSRVTVVKRHRHGPGCGHEWNGTHWIVVTRTAIVAPRGHHCTVNCAHHYDGDRVVRVSRHRHGPGCGHHYDGHRWVIARRIR